MLHLAVIENKLQLAFHIISLLPHPDYLDVRNNWSQVRKSYDVVYEILMSFTSPVNRKTKTKRSSFAQTDRSSSGLLDRAKPDRPAPYCVRSDDQPNR